MMDMLRNLAGWGTILGIALLAVVIYLGYVLGEKRRSR